MSADSSDHEGRELIARCVSRSDEKAWETFMDRYSRLVWSAIHKTFKATSFAYTSEDAEDLFGAFFLSLVDGDFRKLRQFQSRNACTLSTWLTVVAVHMTIDHMRRQSVRPRASADASLAMLDDIIADGAPNAQQKLMDTQRSASIARALGSLTSHDRELYDLLYIKGVSPDAAAQALGTTAATVYTRKHRLIERLKKDLADL